MNRIRKTCLIGGLVLVAVLAPLAVKAWLDRPVWPGFPDNPDGRLQSITAFDNDRDFGYTTGSHVPVTIYLKVPAGATVQLDSLSVRGAMSLLERKVVTQEGTGGQLYVRYDIKVIAFERTPNDPPPAKLEQLKKGWQEWTRSKKGSVKELASFAWEVLTTPDKDPGYKPYWRFTPSVTWRKNAQAKSEQIDLPDVDVYFSRTWSDGRKAGHPLEPKATPRQGYHGYWTLAILGTGIGGTLFCIAYLWRNRKRRIQKPAEKPVVETVRTPREVTYELFARVFAGDRSRETLHELVMQVRATFDLGAASYAELLESGDGIRAAAGVVLRICEHCSGQWSSYPLTDEDVGMLRIACGELLPECQPVAASTGGAEEGDTTGSTVPPAEQDVLSEQATLDAAGIERVAASVLEGKQSATS